MSDVEEVIVTDILKPEQLQQCLRAIYDHPKGPGEVTTSPAKVYHGMEGMTDRVFINFVDPDSLAIGEIYRTWIVTFLDNGQLRVQEFRSRKGDEHGDETLPADD